jgi:hypothetical protein
VPEIFIDGERIEFSGPPPDTVGGLLAVLEPVLTSAGRVLARLDVDGRACPENFTAADFAAAKRIEVFSMTVAEAVARVAASCAAAASSLHAQADALANDVLRAAWPEVRSQCVAFAESAGHLVQDAGALAPHFAGPGAQPEVLTQLIAALERWLDSVQVGDAAETSLQLHRGLGPVLLSLRDGADRLAKGGAT